MQQLQCLHSFPSAMPDPSLLSCSKILIPEFLTK